MAIRVTTNGSSTRTVVSAVAPTVTTVSAASAIKVGKLEDNVGNLDKGDDGIIASGETLVYNADAEKWEAVSLAEQVSDAISEQIGDSVSEALAGAVTLDGGTF